MNLFNSMIRSLEVLKFSEIKSYIKSFTKFLQSLNLLLKILNLMLSLTKTETQIKKELNSLLIRLRSIELKWSFNRKQTFTYF